MFCFYAVLLIKIKYLTVTYQSKMTVQCLADRLLGRLTLSVGALWRCESLQSSAQRVCPGLWSTQAGARLFGGRTPAGPAAAAAVTLTAAPDNETAPPAGYGFLHINKIIEQT